MDSNEDMKDYENLRLVIQEDMGNARAAMESYEYDNWEIEEITEVE